MLSTKIDKYVLAHKLRELSMYELDEWKSKAYSKAAYNLIAEFDEKFTDDFTYINGIGNGINNKIIEFLTTGSIQKLEELKKENDINNQVVIARTGKSPSIKYNINYIDPIVKLFTSTDKKVEVCGSYRRGKEFIGDLDLLVLNSDISFWYEFINKIDATIISSGNSSIDIIYENVPINLRSTSEEGWGAGLLYLTGSRGFNIYMRSKAKELGYKLNQYGLYDEMESVLDSKTEESIFELLSMEYVSPKERNY